MEQRVRHLLGLQRGVAAFRSAWKLLAFCALIGAGRVWAAQMTLVADSHVNSAQPAVNSGAISNLDVGGGYTALLQFDLSMLPAGTTPAQVSRAVLTLYANRVNTPGQVNLAPVTSAWAEYSVTYATEPSLGSSITSFSVSNAGSYVAIDVTALVQGWIANPASNNGVALSAAVASVQFDSKENDLTAHPATLNVELVDQGPAGPAGPAGATGPVGPQGVAGAIGPQGSQGPAGPTGPSGPQGPAGVQGLQGATGAQGPAGAMGPQGPAGPTGATGPQGPAGPAGAAGLTYQGAYVSTQNYAQGDVVLWQGSSYASLVASNHGNTPSGSPQQWGLIAAQGAEGPAGATGAAGPQGPQGLPGTQGLTGPAGPQGPQGIAGQAGAQGIPGATGATGATGPMGPQGPAGPVGMTYQGAYSSTVNYALADAVTFNGSSYVSLNGQNHGNTPDQSPQQWALIAAAGAAGPAGAPGAAGATGAVGPAGPEGPQGPVGPQGATGPQGPPVANYRGVYQSAVNYALADAVSWQGSTYISLAGGNLGNTPSLSPAQWAVLAAQGATGATGPQGPAGPAGATGAAGAPGATGPQGPPVSFRGGWLVSSSYAVGDSVSYSGSSYIALAANTGREPDVSPDAWGLLAAAGAAGSTGPQGPQGLQGPSGIAGATGATGPQGPQGPAGPQGPQGPTGQTGPQGLPGATGPAGATGATGLPGTNGTNGTNGAPGPPGMTFRGAWQSNYGYAATDAVTYGNPASTYIALAANSAEEPDLYPQTWAVLAQAGPAGPGGPTGAAATIAIGTVTTGAAGSQASVTNSGSSTAAVLNFTIPQGAAGASGGGGGSGTSGVPFTSVYHSVQNIQSYPYFSVNASTGSTSEAAPNSVLTWVPAGCTATALNVFSEQGGSVTVTLRVGTPGSMASTALACTASTGTSCTQSGNVVVPANGFVDYIFSGANSTAAGVWTALSCN